MKRQIRNLVGQACHCSGLLSLTERRHRSDLTILCYHRVLPADRKAAYYNPDLVVTPDAFEAHCSIVRRYYKVQSLSDALRGWQTDGTPHRPAAAITFDDGYADNFEHAGPILDHFGLQATFFVISGLVGTDHAPWYDAVGRAMSSPTQAECAREITSRHLGQPITMPRDAVEQAKRLDPAKRRAFVSELAASVNLDAGTGREDRIMNRDQLREMIQAGHEIGAHSRTHEILTQLDDGALDDEVAGSKTGVEALIGSEVNAFCYPNGDTDARVQDAVKRAGYGCAVTMQPGLNAAGGDSYQLRRWLIHEDRLAGLGCPASTTLLRMELCGLSQRVFRRSTGSISQ